MKQIEAAHPTIDELGRLGIIEFVDQNPHVSMFQRYFVNEVNRCVNMERKINFLENEIFKDKKLAAILERNMYSGVDLFSYDVLQMTEMDLGFNELETRLEELENELKQININAESLQRNYNELIEIQHVLTKDAIFFQEQNLNDDSERKDHSAKSPLLQEDTLVEVQKQGVKLSFVTGVMNTDRIPQFQRVLWRATRGNNFSKDSIIDEPIIDPKTGDEVNKTVFIVFFQGERLEDKIKKICLSFEANLYECPDSSYGRTRLLEKIMGRIMDLNIVIERSREHRKQLLINIVEKIVGWKRKVLKEKSIYHSMNKFDYDVGRKCLIGRGWCPKTGIEEIQVALRAGTTKSGVMVPSVLSVIRPNEEPPTHFETNKYVSAFQQIVNAYGVAKYREVNPAVMTIITFPFLFALMFGDVGHGLMLLAVAVAFIKMEKNLSGKKLNELVQMPFDGRYVLFLMGLFSIYVGFIYNECFAIPMDIFGTSWKQNGKHMVFQNQTYPFGVDPVWKGAPNELEYYNSFKMKISVLFGVIQMTVGIVFSLMNYLNMKGPMKWINIFTQFIPQVVFLWSIFGYMCFLILLKWGSPYDDYILPTIIDMFLSPGSIKTPIYSGQQGVQTILLILAFISVPVMLIPKPLLMKKLYEKEMEAKSHGYHLQGGGGGESGEEEAGEFEEEALEADGHHGDRFEMSDVFVHQVIHTIEFVLGAISNTASYLRLWALSLAHSELSTVFWNRILTAGIYSGPFLAFIAFGAWLGATIGVLLMMETLSAFLHALRLHWVEFNNKSDAKRKEVYKAAKVKAPPDDPNSYVIKYYLDGETKYYINRDFNACLNIVTIAEAYLKGKARPTLLCPFKKDNPEDD
ncbi:vacuolar proton ATPase 100-kDa subunit [Heterostelium album PN500]|uniref:V-type proton ATPase subunit a n=1 Tax=Heterostelium pallidum (strain ATCC 26659 / Pp 5 / PN500) TaxID=670386 RepID=D3BUC4_HETP5|nr:vacuolar proton ATPase 100-kDa subunit [Heterostelium album PN500]EFA74712.1 vacuolar proton ATPase 100-kDa subunit [Heterostelium album PN500]|eukprot:XP_020426846.1 vacuolar proton ATPase 100-kDa subunit [Heterostelium album PN500]